MHGIPDGWGTAVNVQAMVFGNMGDDCATGVAFTRDPSTGERGFYGEYLVNAQGEDVVAGIRTPQPINRASREPGQESPADARGGDARGLPRAGARLQTLEQHYRDMQDIEFTIQQGGSGCCRRGRGKRTGAGRGEDRRRPGEARA